MSEVLESVTCEVCSERYVSGKKDPLSLPCGHTFCRACLTSIKNTGNFLCPSCRRPHNQQSVEQLPVIYSLLRISASYVDFEEDSCKDHGDDLKYWCYDCKLPLCALCLYSGHQGGHKVQLAKYFLQEKKRELEGQAETILEMIKQQQNQARNNFGQVCSNIFYLLQSEANLANLVQDVQQTTSIITVFDLADLLKQMQSEIKVNEISAHIEGLDVGKEKKITENIGEKATENAPDKIGTKMKTDKGEMAKSSVRMESTHKNEADTACGAAAAVKCEEFRGPIDCCKGRLLLRSLKIPTAPKQSPQVEVFLELSVGDWCLGRVFLRLWTHLRRAQHFLALCLGCYGYTFMGASASAVLNKGSPREALVFYDCMKNNTQGSDQGIINGLEWGGQYQGSVKEGVVTGCTHRNGHNNASSFAITTVSQAGGKYECPFGEITSGLAIIKAAVINDPVTKVKITNCGMVVPDVTQ